MQTVFSCSLYSSSSFAQYNMDQFIPAKLEGCDEPVCFIPFFLIYFLKEQMPEFDFFIFFYFFCSGSDYGAWRLGSGTFL